jgi:glutamate carboxypeptidase
MTHKWTDYFQERLVDILQELRTYVEMETPTLHKEAVDRLGEYIAGRFRSLGCKVEVLPQPVYGNQLRVEYGTGDEQLLILGHFDTVKEIGTLASEPWRIEEGKAYGPGVYDMKSGIVFSYFALKAIIERGLPLQKKLVFFWNTDEEIGSPSSEAFIRKEAEKSAIALVIEPSYGDGFLKTSRKGGGDFLLRVKGRAAHAGNDHAKGINAIEEMARHILTIQSWTNYEAGTTLSVGTIKGGTASNVVPDFAEAEIDFRVSKTEEAERIFNLLRQLTPTAPGADVHFEIVTNKPPMERTEKTAQLFLHAKEQAALEGIALQEIGVGGTSDGNFAAAVGTPVLDGLGPVGDGAHAPHEHIVVDAIPSRIALLLRLLTSL